MRTCGACIDNTDRVNLTKGEVTRRKFRHHEGRRPLSALIQARFSTEEQRPTSIDDQNASCRRFLDANLPKGMKPSQLVIDYVKEPEISGEVANRPGINQVWAGIDAKRWDLVIAEESSRLYRHHTKAGELFESAVDAGVRVICPTDCP